jgi:hypothetical protein
LSNSLLGFRLSLALPLHKQRQNPHVTGDSNSIVIQALFVGENSYRLRLGKTITSGRSFSRSQWVRREGYSSSSRWCPRLSGDYSINPSISKFFFCIDGVGHE